jgi:hypothetical protein
MILLKEIHVYNALKDKTQYKIAIMENISAKDFIASKKEQLTLEIEEFIKGKVNKFIAETGFIPYIKGTVGTTSTQTKCGIHESPYVNVETSIKL